MKHAVKPRRSVLYMPGSNARALEKASKLPVDGLIFDLEDSVAPDAKEEARRNVCEAMGKGGHGSREVIVRVNDLATPWGRDDIVAAADAGPDGILLPKVEDPKQIEKAAGILRSMGKIDEVAIWCMIETPVGVLRAERIADPDNDVTGLVMGTADLVKDLGARHTQDRVPLIAALGHCVLAARARGLAILDGVHLDLEDAKGLRAACIQGRDMGFDGKTLIHPDQVATANKTFGPNRSEIAEAKRTIAAHEKATGGGKGVAVVDGKLVETLHVEAARRTLEMADAIREAEAAR